MEILLTSGICACIDSCPCLSLSLNLSLNLTATLTAVKCNVIVLCNLHTREMLLCLPAADVAAHCSSVLLLCCCSAAQVQLVGLCNHWVRLHSCTLPVLLLKLLLWLGLGWRVQTFFVSLSWVSITWVLWLGYLEQVFPWKLSKLSKFTSWTRGIHVFPPSLRK